MRIIKFFIILQAMGIFKNIFQELTKISNISNYDKICAITSFYRRLKADFQNKENKDSIVGEYKLLNMNNNNNKCYKLVYDFITKIIDNLKKILIFFCLYYKLILVLVKT